MPKISILLPSLRPKLLQSTLFGISICSAGHDYEVIVVSPDPVSGERVRWVKETEKRGCIAAHLRAFEESAGDVIVLMTDDTIVLPGWLDAIATTIGEGEKQYFPYCVGLNRLNSRFVGTVFGKYYAYFPAISRRSLDAVGGLFDPRFTAHWADPDLGLRIWDAGGRVEFCEKARAAVSSLQRHFVEAAHKSSAFERDARSFMAKWGHLAGEEFSREIRAVNRDLPVEALQERTILMEPSHKVVVERRTLGQELRRRLRPPRYVRRFVTHDHVRSLYESTRMPRWSPARMYAYELGRLAAMGYLDPCGS